jgi:hypothetical protein
MLREYFSENCGLYEILPKNLIQLDRPQIKIQYGARPFYAGYLRLQIHTQNMQYFLIFHYNNYPTNAPQCYVTRALAAMYSLVYTKT